MEETSQLSLKRIEPSLSKFNEVIVPHHLDLLRQHKANILKYSRAGDVARARSEREAAARACGRLRAHVCDLDALRDRLSPCDQRAFRAATAPARQATLQALAAYRDVTDGGGPDSSAAPPRTPSDSLSIPVREEAATAGGGGVAASVTSGESVGVLGEEEEPAEAPLDRLQLRLEEPAGAAECERELRHLEREVEALRDAWAALHEAAGAQREPVAHVGASVERAAGEVRVGRARLAAAARLGAGGALWAGGLAAALAAGGPVALLLGVKAGVAAALAGSALAVGGARLLRPDPDPGKTE